jgi:beta-phosphoglucomutase family hydrolase
MISGRQPQLRGGGPGLAAVSNRHRRAVGRIYGYIGSVLGLPDGITACLFDLDGVLTSTATVHNAAWTEMFDDYLRVRARRTGQPQAPFDPVQDYNSYVDGRPRADGVRTFLASRGITLPDGSPNDPPRRETVHGIANRKNEILLRLIRDQGVKPYPGSVRYLEAAKAAGLRRAVVSASANCAEVVRAAGLEDLLEVRVDGIVAAERHLRGKPAPDTFLVAAEELGVPAKAAVVFEDSVAGVQAGRDGGFGYVVGVDRVGHAADLQRHGASVVVRDLAELLDDS